MKRNTKTIVTIAAIAAAGTIALAGASLAERGFGGRHGGGYGPGHGGVGPRILTMFQKFDVDQDGRLTQAEIDDARQGHLVRFDADKDGQLSLKEFEGLWLDRMRERMVDHFQRLDADGDGVVTKEEFGAPTAFIVVLSDRNGDGALSLDDMGRGWDKRHGGQERDKDD